MGGGVFDFVALVNVSYAVRYYESHYGPDYSRIAMVYLAFNELLPRVREERVERIKWFASRAEALRWANDELAKDAFIELLACTPVRVERRVTGTRERVKQVVREERIEEDVHSWVPV